MIACLSVPLWIFICGSWMIVGIGLWELLGGDGR